jgi:hypothetical protein
MSRCVAGGVRTATQGSLGRSGAVLIEGHASIDRWKAQGQPKLPEGCWTVTKLPGTEVVHVTGPARLGAATVTRQMPGRRLGTENEKELLGPGPICPVNSRENDVLPWPVPSPLTHDPDTLRLIVVG